MKYRKGEFLVIPNKMAMKGLKPSIQAVYMWICSFADENGQCFPSIKLIADCAGVSKRTVIYAIQELENIGLLSHDNRKNGIENLTNLYQIEIVDKVVPSAMVALPPSAKSALPSENSALPPSAMVAQVTESTLSNSIHLTVGVPTPSKRFIKPTLGEIQEYCKERKNGVDPERFYNFYESKGWMVGKNNMKNWKACVHTWEKESSVKSDYAMPSILEF